MEILWKIHKKNWKLSGISFAWTMSVSYSGYPYLIPSFYESFFININLLHHHLPHHHHHHNYYSQHNHQQKRGFVRANTFSVTWPSLKTMSVITEKTKTMWSSQERLTRVDFPRPDSPTTIKVNWNPRLTARLNYKDDLKIIMIMLLVMIIQSLWLLLICTILSYAHVI